MLAIFLNHKAIITKQSKGFFRITGFVLLVYKQPKDLPKVIIHIWGDLTHSWMLYLFEQPASPSALVIFPSSFIGERRRPSQWWSQAESGQGQRPFKALNSHRFHSLLFISILGSSFFAGHQYVYPWKQVSGLWLLKITEAQTVAKEWHCTWKIFPVPWIWRHTPSRHYLVSDQSSSAPQVGLSVGLGHIPLCSGLRRFHYNLGYFQSVLTSELELP